MFAPQLRIRSAAWLLLCWLGGVRDAHADLSSWLYAGVGPAFAEQAQTAKTRVMLDLQTGMGTNPQWPVGIGGVFKLPIYFGSGTDLGLAARFGTRGFNTGGFGVALDVGGYQRWWGVDSTGLSGALVLGAPWGLTLSAGALSGSHDTREGSITLGIDFARLTVHRTSGGTWWQNIVLPTRR